MSGRAVVSDASPIRALAHLDHLDLLGALFGEVLIPPAVRKELDQPRARFVRIPLKKITSVTVRQPADPRTVQAFLVELGPGEAEALALALEVRADAVLIDESAGRAAAKRVGLRPLGVLGILLRGIQRELVGPIEPLMNRLQGELGFFISPAVRAEVLKRASEG